jgi:hypothetical protein
MLGKWIDPTLEAQNSHGEASTTLDFGGFEKATNVGVCFDPPCLISPLSHLFLQILCELSFHIHFSPHALHLDNVALRNPTTCSSS